MRTKQYLHFDDTVGGHVYEFIVSTYGGGKHKGGVEFQINRYDRDGGMIEGLDYSISSLADIGAVASLLDEAASDLM